MSMPSPKYAGSGQQPGEHMGMKEHSRFWIALWQTQCLECPRSVQASKWHGWLLL